MARRLFTLLSALSLVLCVVTCALWVYSYKSCGAVGRKGWSGDRLYWKEQSWALSTSPGGLSFQARKVTTYETPEIQWKLYGPKDPPGLRFHSSSWSPDQSLRHNDVTLWQRAGFRWRADHFDKTYTDERYAERTRLVMRDTRFSIPLWFLATMAFAGFVPLLSSRYQLARSHSRLANRLCPWCGYDLRATPGRCPECGTALEPKAA